MWKGGPKTTFDISWELDRNVESQVPPQILIRIGILTRTLTRWFICTLMFISIAIQEAKVIVKYFLFFQKNSFFIFLSESFFQRLRS